MLSPKKDKRTARKKWDDMIWQGRCENRNTLFEWNHPPPPEIYDKFIQNTNDKSHNKSSVTNSSRSSTSSEGSNILLDLEGYKSYKDEPTDPEVLHISRKSHPLDTTTLEPIYAPASEHPNMLSTRTRVSLEEQPNISPWIWSANMIPRFRVRIPQLRCLQLEYLSSERNAFALAASLRYYIDPGASCLVTTFAVDLYDETETEITKIVLPPPVEIEPQPCEPLVIRRISRLPLAPEPEAKPIIINPPWHNLDRLRNRSEETNPVPPRVQAVWDYRRGLRKDLPYLGSPFLD